MKNATLYLNPSDGEPKYYPVEVLLKGQNQELPEDVDPAKKEVSGCACVGGEGRAHVRSSNSLSSELGKRLGADPTCCRNCGN
jgi:hypothetical protein